MKSDNDLKIRFPLNSLRVQELLIVYIIVGTRASTCRVPTKYGTTADCVGECGCPIPFTLDVRLVGAPAGVTQEEGHTGSLHLPSAVLALIQPSFPRRPDKSFSTTCSSFFLRREWDSRPNVRRFFLHCFVSQLLYHVTVKIKISTHLNLLSMASHTGGKSCWNTHLRIICNFSGNANKYVAETFTLILLDRRGERRSA